MSIFSFYKPKIIDVHFHKDNWEGCDNFENNKSWYTDKRDPARIQLLGSPAPWAFDLRDEQAARAFFEAQSQSLGGAMLEIAVETIAGVECLVGVFKYKSPIPEYLGMYYVGIVWMAFEKFSFQVNFESLEQGTTGMREAMVALIAKPQFPKSDQEPVMLASMDEFFTRIKQAAIRVVPSDDKKYDEMLPDHPLSKVRALLEYFRQNVQLNKKLVKQKPYRFAG